jgi:hypothetical protein
MRGRPFLVTVALAALATVDLALGAGVGHAASSSSHAARSSKHAARSSSHAARRSRHAATRSRHAATRSRHAASTSTQSIEIRTVPVGRHLRFALAGRVYTTDQSGSTIVPAADVQVVNHDLRTNPLLLKLLPNRRPDGSYFRLERWYTPTRKRNAVYAAIDLYRPVRFSLVSRTGRPISVALVDSFQMKRIDGELLNLTGSQLQQPVILQASRVVPLNTGLVSKNLLYRIQRVSIGGNNLVHRAQQFFLPSESVDFKLRLLFYSVRFEAQDILFGFSIGSSIRLVYPNGRVEVHPFQGHGQLALAALPRGTYHVSVVGPGLSPSAPVSVTRDHVTQLKVLSYLDIAVLTILFLALLFGLAVVRRPALRRRLSPRWRVAQRRALRRSG